MKIIKIKPTSNSVRHYIKLYKGTLLKTSRIIKNIHSKKYSMYGRSKTFGCITSWHKQRGKKRIYRNLEIQNKTRNSIIIGTTYDPNRSSLISINFDLNSKKFFSDITTKNSYSGSIIQVNKLIGDLKIGYRTQLKRIPAGTIVHSICNESKKHPTYVKSAGTFAQIVQIGKITAKLKMPSGQILEIPINSYVSLGAVSNENHNLVVIGKAGRQEIMDVVLLFVVLQ